MLQSLKNIFVLGLKEIQSLRSDLVMCVLIGLSFTVFVIVPAKNAALDTRNASIAIVDADRTALSRAIWHAMQQPQFKPPVLLDSGDVDAVMASSRYTFVLQIPARFQADLVDGRQPRLQLLVDATAMSQAGNGASYLGEIISSTISAFTHSENRAGVLLNTRIAYNPNLYGSWFFAISNIINMIAMLSIVLTGAALIRERERGTIEHLLVMPLRPVEIALGKIWANGAVILGAMMASLLIVVHGVLDVPLQGSLLLYFAGAALYLFAVASIGIFLATIARSMPQFGLLFLPVVIMIVVLSGGLTPLEAMPKPIQWFMSIMPSSHFTSFAMAVLFRGATVDQVWQQLAAMAGIVTVFLSVALLRFRSAINSAG